VCCPEAMRTIEELIEQHPDEWLAIDVKAEKEGRPTAGDLVYHARDQEAVWQKTRNRKRLFIVYAGPPLKKGYVAAF
jgi:hypothetical protein